MLEFELKDVRFEGGEDVLNWPHVQYENFFVFYNPDHETEQSGFRFMSIEIIGMIPGTPILNPENNVEILYWGYACFDGIRHLYLGNEKTENYGYINYPYIKHHIKLLEIMRELEIKYCWDEE